MMAMMYVKLRSANFDINPRMHKLCLADAGKMSLSTTICNLGLSVGLRFLKVRYNESQN